MCSVWWFCYINLEFIAFDGIYIVGTSPSLQLLLPPGIAKTLSQSTADYMGIDNMNFGPFSNTMRRQCVPIQVVQDSVPENDENFKVTLSENVDGVVVNDAGSMTTVNIIDCE